jgi:glutaredoxin
MKKVKMYTLSTCPWCMKTKKWFKQNKIPFTYVDYDLVNEDEQQQIRAEIDGYGVERTFPVVVIGEEVVSGYDLERYAELLGR